ncbi:MAG: helix-turn-helix transcriptional regulator [Elusimicrobiota bacterium]
MVSSTADTFALLGRRIREERKVRGLTQQQLADVVGMDAGHLSRVEHGKAVPSINAVKKIADALALPIAKLFADIPLQKAREDRGWARKLGAVVRDVPPRHREKILRILKTIVRND